MPATTWWLTINLKTKQNKAIISKLDKTSQQENKKDPKGRHMAYLFSQ